MARWLLAAVAAAALAWALAGCGAPERASAPVSSPSPTATMRRSQTPVIFDGDSLTEGYMLAPSQSYPSQAMRQLSVELSFANFGISGQTWPDLLSDVEREVDPLYSGERKINVVVVWAGANDFAVGYSAEEVFENARRYCEARKRRGFTVATLTMYPLQPKDLDRDYDAIRRRYNALLREHWSEFADALVDVAADERIGDHSGGERSRYFIDPVHLNAAGYGVIADCVVPVLDRIITDQSR